MTTPNELAEEVYCYFRDNEYIESCKPNLSYLLGAILRYGTVSVQRQDSMVKYLKEKYEESHRIWAHFTFEFED